MGTKIEDSITARCPEGFNTHRICRRIKKALGEIPIITVKGKYDAENCLFSASREDPNPDGSLGDVIDYFSIEFSRDLTVDEMTKLNNILVNSKACKHTHGNRVNNLALEDLDEAVDWAPGATVFCPDAPQAADPTKLGTIVYRGPDGWRRSSDDTLLVPL